MTGDQQLSEQSGVEESPDHEDDHQSHLSDVADGSGCTEIWEHLSERRESDDDEE